MSSSSYTETWLSGPSSTQFYARTYAPATFPPKAAIVFLHGFAEHIGRYTHFHPLLTARGIAVFAYDQRGFGLTGQDMTGKKSKSSSYGKTSWKEQMSDIDWAIGHAKQAFENVPIFLMGHSMGGGEVLGFGCHGKDSPHQSTLESLHGIIATSPLILQAKPAPKLARWIGGKLSSLLPSILIPAPVNADDLSHDEQVNGNYLKDPLVKAQGSLKGINDMLNKGEWLLHEAHSNWLKNLPVLIVHGTEDKVTSHEASKAFHDKIPAIKKKLALFDGGFHELQNEPGGVKEKLANEIIAFIEEHSRRSFTSETEDEQVAESEHTHPPPITEASVEPTGGSSVRAKM